MIKKLTMMIVIVLPVIAFAQDAGVADPELSGGFQLGFGIYEILAPILAALLGWVGVKLNALLQAKTKNELLGGILRRLNDSIFDSVKKVNQTALAQIKAARAPTSPGGVKVTSVEAKELKAAVWDEIRHEYGGMSGLQTALGVLGIGGGDEGLSKYIDRKIESAVHDTKLATKAAGSDPK